MGLFTYDPKFDLKCERCYRQLAAGERYFSLHPAGRWGPRCLPCEEIHTVEVIAASETSLQRYRDHLDRVRAEMTPAAPG